MEPGHDPFDYSQGLPQASGEGDNELWLLSYSDMMTLLFGFFVLMYVFALNDKDDRALVMQDQLAKQFNGDVHTYVAEIVTDLQKAIVKIPELEDVEVQENREGIVIGFKTSLAFDSGDAELRARTKASLQEMIARIKEKAEAYPIIVEGHTDDRPLTTSRYKDNWELSAARAASVVREFERAGFESSHLTAVGMGSSRPAAPNRDVAGRTIAANLERNRRVAIRIAIPGRVSPESK
ncbi:MAG: OmpA family protein [Bdellovibrionota bacterium]